MDCTRIKMTDLSEASGDGKIAATHESGDCAFELSGNCAIHGRKVSSVGKSLSLFAMKEDGKDNACSPETMRVAHLRPAAIRRTSDVGLIGSGFS
jgi:hypothetical protein